MTDEEIAKFVPRGMRNELFYFIARGCMILATVVGLPVAGFMLTRMITQADALQSTVIQLNVETKLLNQSVSSKFDAHLTQLTDHELRLRSLERPR